MKAAILSCLLLSSLPALAAGPIDETRPLAAGGLVEVSNVAGSIRVTGTDRTDVRITGSLGEGAEGLEIDGNAQRLRIEVKHPQGGSWGGWWGGGARADTTLEIELPRTAALKLEAVSASIDVSGMASERIEAESVSGSVAFDGEAAELALEAVSGSIEATTRASREVQIETVSGRVRLDGAVSERVRVESVSGGQTLTLRGEQRHVETSGVSGSIELDTALASGGRLNAETLSGKLQVTLPKSTSARLAVSTFSGSIRSDAGEVEREEFGPGASLTTRLGDGNGTIELESFSGSVTLRLQ